MNQKEIGEMIKVRRLSRNMTQEDLAEATGLAQSTIAGYESGTRKPSTPAAEALADAFNVPLWSIFYREDEVIPLEYASERSGAPRTSEARMISAGIDNMPPEERKRAVELFEVVFSRYLDKEEQP